MMEGRPNLFGFLNTGISIGINHDHHDHYIRDFEKQKRDYG